MDSAHTYSFQDLLDLNNDVLLPEVSKVHSLFLAHIKADCEVCRITHLMIHLKQYYLATSVYNDYQYIFPSSCVVREVSFVKRVETRAILSSLLILTRPSAPIVRRYFTSEFDMNLTRTPLPLKTGNFRNVGTNCQASTYSINKI